MTQSQFDFLCKTLGDRSLPVEERWKSIAYIHVHGSYEPMGSFQELLASDRIYYYYNDELGGGFVYISHADSAYDVINSGYNVSWIGLDAISEITFKGMDYNKLPEGSEPIYGVTDVMNNMFGLSISPLPTFVRVDKIITTVKDAENVTPSISVSRKSVTFDDLVVTYFDSYGNKLDKRPTTVGKYTLRVTCQNNYSGYGENEFIINP